MSKKIQTLILGISFILIFLIALIKVDSLFKRMKDPVSNNQLPGTDRSFVFVVPTHNTTKLCKKVLSSIFEQSYKNFRVIYIDDGSTDDTFQKANQLVTESYPTAPITILRNENRKGTLESVYEWIQTCKDYEIVILMEGNCRLSHQDVLKDFNDLYKNQGIWLAYGQHKEYQTDKEGKCKKVSSANLFSNSMRKKYWVRPRIKSFYAGLFKKIQLHDFFFRGQFVDETFDSAYMFPMLEMAGAKVGFLPKISCVVDHPDYLEKNRPCQRAAVRCKQSICRSKPYKLLENHPGRVSLETKKQHGADLVIFSYDRPLQLYATLESTLRYITGLHKITVIYRCSDPRFAEAYEDVQQFFKKVTFLRQSERPHEDFKPLVLQTIFDKSEDASPYIIFATDDIIAKDYANLSECIDLMESAGAYFFSLRLGLHTQYCYMADIQQNIPYHVSVAPKVMGWLLDSAKGDWNYPNSVDMTLYRKSDIQQTFHEIKFRHPNDLEGKWVHYTKPFTKHELRNRVGLCYEKSKIINIPLNVVNISENRNMNLYSAEELLKRYEEGKKIDIQPLYQIENISPHMEIEPTFITR